MDTTISYFQFFEYEIRFGIWSVIFGPVFSAPSAIIFRLISYLINYIHGWTRGAQVKLWDPLRRCAIPERLRGVFTTRRYANSRLPLPLPSKAGPFVTPTRYISQAHTQLSVVNYSGRWRAFFYSRITVDESSPVSRITSDYSSRCRVKNRRSW